MSRSITRLLILIGLLLCAVTLASAQDAAIVGTVSDPTGAVIPGATITVTNTETGQTFTTTSNDAGAYVLPALRIGTCSVKVEAKGFKTWNTTGMVLQVGDRARVDAKMEVGTASDAITVESNIIRVQSESAEISDVVTGTQITNLMSNGRHFGVLAALVPGASSNMTGFQFPQAGNVDISFNGANAAHNVWLADGAENYDRGGWGTMFMPSMDAVGEFRTLTSNYGAEYGLASGATMSMVFKSGTRNLHGTLWEFMRNKELNANDWFRNKSGSKKAPETYNLYGFNIGGPVALGSYNKNRDKTFFFYNMEWRKRRTSGTTTQSVAPDAWYTGDMSSLSTTIKVPDASALSQAQIDRFAAVGLAPGQAFPNNKIPAGLITSQATAILGTGIMPRAQYMQNGVGKWTGGTASPQNVREELVKVDHRFTDKFSVFGHYLAESMDRVDAPATWSGGSYPTVSSMYSNPSYSYVIHATYNIAPTLLSETAFSGTGNKIDILSRGNYTRPSGFTSTELFSGNSDNRIPVIAWGNELGTTYNTWSQPWKNKASLWQIRQDLSYVKGRHEMKFGGSFETYKKTQQIFGNTQGNFNFNGSFTGSGFADFLLGYAASYNELALQDSGNWVNHSTALYFQDNWRVTNRLTLTLGLRWEGMPAVVEENNRQSSFYEGLYNKANAPRFVNASMTNAQMDPTGPGFQTVSGVPLSSTPFYMNGIGLAGKGVPEGLVNNYWNNWAPRVGLAYDVTGKGKTVLRMGFGRMYERVQGNDVYNGGGNSPFSFSPTVNNVLFSNPGTSVVTNQTASAPIFPAGITGKVLDGYKSPNSNQWSASVQHELFPRSVLSVAYVGNNAFHQSSQRDVNTPYYTDTTNRAAIVAKTVDINRVRPYLGWGTLVLAENQGNGNYHSLQTNLRVNASKGLDLQMTYTLSRAINDVRAGGSGGDLGTIDNPYDRSYNRGLATWDRTHVFAFNYRYQLPIFKDASRLVKGVLGGWQVSGITTFSSGAITPITMASSNSLGMGGNVTNHPDFSGSVDYQNGTIVNGTPVWIGKSGFATPAALAWGNCKKDAVRGPGRNNWDMALIKDFAGIPFINKEGASLQFRLEAFNVFNHTQWSGFEARWTNANFGNVNGAFAPRNLELGLRFVF